MQFLKIWSSPPPFLYRSEFLKHNWSLWSPNYGSSDCHVRGPRSSQCASRCPPGPIPTPSRIFSASRCPRFLQAGSNRKCIPLRLKEDGDSGDIRALQRSYRTFILAGYRHKELFVTAAWWLAEKQKSEFFACTRPIFKFWKLTKILNITVWADALGASESRPCRTSRVTSGIKPHIDLDKWHKLSCSWGEFTAISRGQEEAQKWPCSRASLVAQWLGIHLPMQGTRVRALVRKIPYAAEQLSPWATTTEPTCHNYRSLSSRVHGPQQEKPPQWEAHAPQWRVAPACRN